MAFQMAIITLLGVLAGQKLDSYFGMERPLLTMVGALVGIFLAFYISLKDLIFPKE